VDSSSFEVLVGVPEGTGRDDGLSNAFLAYIHDNGSPINNIPARPFIKQTIEENAEYVSKMMLKALMSKDPEAILAELGEVMAGKIKAKIMMGVDPALQPETVKKKKGNALPLFDTGQMMESINYIVRKK